MHVEVLHVGAFARERDGDRLGLGMAGNPWTCRDAGGPGGGELQKATTGGLRLSGLCHAVSPFWSDLDGQILPRDRGIVKGRLSGAAGAVEGVATLQALRAKTAPPTLNLEEPDEDLDLDYVPLEARELSVNGHPAIGMSNSFGFGGHNVVLVMEAAA